MKIREVRAQNLRNFGPDAPAVSFVDPDTKLVRPLTILVGANGSGKTTLLELIEVIAHALNFSLLGEDLLRPEGTLTATLQLDADIRWTLFAHWKPARSDADIVIDFKTGKLEPGPGPLVTPSLIYFPSLRPLPMVSGGSIKPPKEYSSNVYRYDPDHGWRGSLSELWVWQNYLDLEAHAEGHPNLLPFVETIQTILGGDQTIKIRRGDVWIHRPHRGDEVQTHQLPSGEQQILVLFGELIRRLKPGSIVLIDELEISLHPALQRTVVYHLRRLARQHDLQVIITTHSMEIVAYADPSEIVNLDDMVFIEQAARTAEAAE